MPTPLSGQPGGDLSATPTDPRAARTRALLRDALMEQVRERDWPEITTSDICRHAGIARSSFYEHYRGKADLLDEVFADRMRAVTPARRAGDPLGTIDWLVDHVAEAPGFLAHAMAGGRGDALLPRFRAALTSVLRRELEALGVSDAGAKAAYVIGGSLSYLAETGEPDAKPALQRLAARILSD